MSQSLQQALDRCLDCPGVIGAVLASPEGLVLASAGAYGGDVPAACAASLAIHVRDDLGLLAGADPDELLVWADGGLWHLSRVAGTHVVLLGSTDTVNAGALRIVAASVTASLGRLLGVP